MIALFRTKRVREPPTSCRFCAHFENDPHRIEQAVSGLTSMSSGHASVRADDGLCRRHERYVRATYGCADFR